MKIIPPGIPSGAIFPFAGNVAPAGYLICDGSIISRSQYATLFAAIGVLHGSGDGSTTFHLPDYRGRFLRGADNMGSGAAGRDPDAAARTAANSGGSTGATVGSVQADSLQNVTANIPGTNKWHSTGTANGAFAGGYSNHTDSNSSGSSRGMNSLSFDASRVARTSTETRGQNAAVVYIIKV